MIEDAEKLEGIRESTISFLSVDSGKIEEKIDFVAVEEPIHILLNEEHYATILCTPTDREALVIGNLFSEGIVNSLEEIREIKIGKRGECRITLERDIDVIKRLDFALPFKRLVLSSCGSMSQWPFFLKSIDRVKIPKINVKTCLKAEVVLKSVRQLNDRAIIFRKTGGVHAAALYEQNGELISFSEDVGRHNAVDKVIGLALRGECDFEQCFLASTGRLTGDIVLKASRLRIPVVASLASALDSGIEVARKTGITLIGFVRGYRMNLYTHPERIIF